MDEAVIQSAEGRGQEEENVSVKTLAFAVLLSASMVAQGTIEIRRNGKVVAEEVAAIAVPSSKSRTGTSLRLPS